MPKKRSRKKRSKSKSSLPLNIIIPTIIITVLIMIIIFLTVSVTSTNQSTGSQQGSTTDSHQDLTTGQESSLTSCITDSDCDDSNPCTTDYCRGNVTCFYSNLADGELCPNGYCVNGSCSDTCGDGFCDNWEDDSSCPSDCLIETSEPTVIECYANSDCNDSNPCTNDYCLSNECVYLNLSQETYCLGGYCSSGVCVNSCGDSVCQSWESESSCPSDCFTVECDFDSDCDDSNECTLDSCVDYSCSYLTLSDGTTCINGSCVSGSCIDTCGDGSCQSWEDELTCPSDCVTPECVSDTDCLDSNPCTLDQCVGGSCSQTILSDGFHGSCCIDGVSCLGDVCACVNGSCVDTCGDSICQSWENTTVCAEDCVEVTELKLFSDGGSSELLTFNYPDSSLNISFDLPVNADISQASLKMSGSGFNDKGFNFAAPTSVVTVTSAWQLVSGDFNGDGNLDVISLDQSYGKIGYHRGKGDGTFQAMSSYSGYGTPSRFIVANVDGDGDDDLLITNYYSKTVYFARNDGGFFVKAGTYTLPSYGSIYVTSGDYDEDGKLDFIYVGGDKLYFAKGDGTGSFAAGVPYDAISSVYGLKTADINEDGNLDILFTDSVDAQVGILFGVGDGSFSAPSFIPAFDRSYNLLIDDFDGDGDLDLLVPHPSDSFSFIEGKGDGSFESYVGIELSFDSGSFITEDFDDDGKLDLVTVGFNDNKTYVLTGNGDGTFNEPVSFSVEWPAQSVSGDFNKDGAVDLVVLNMRPPNYYNLSYIENTESSLYYPSDPVLGVGSLTSIDWSLTGEFNSDSYLQGASFVNSLNNLLPDCSCSGCTLYGGGAYCSIKLNFTTNTPGLVDFEGLSINYTLS